MKTTTHRFNPGREHGSALMFTVVLTGIIGFVLATYLTLVQSQNGANARSQTWNSSMPIVEAGIEDAMAHLNKNGTTNGSLASDGWAATGGGYTVTRTVGDCFYTVTILNYNPGSPTNSPLIESKGYVPMPFLLASAPGPLLAASSGRTVNYLGRGVRVRTVQEFIFTKGIVARDNVDLHGHQFFTDSFDSTDAAASSNGMYSSAMARDNGDIAVNSSLTNSLNTGHAQIFGHVSVGPGGTMAMGDDGSIGSKAWHQAGNTGVEDGWSHSDMNVSFPDVTVPFSGGAFTPSGGWITNTTTTGTNAVTTAAYYDYILDDGDYQKDNLAGSVYVRGNARLYVTDALNLSGLAILSTKSLLVYCSAATANLAGNSSANTSANSDGTADKFSFWGLPSCTSISLGGDTRFTGTIYAPNAAFTLNGEDHDDDGDDHNTTDFVGASITRTATLRGHFNFHYDEALGKAGPHRGFIAKSWNEMTALEVPILSVTLAGSP